MIVAPKYQTTGRRILAAFVDSLVFLPVEFFRDWLFSLELSPENMVFASLFDCIIWTLYAVIGHRKYGQTLGKNLLGIKVLSINERNVIGYGRAFIRESVWFFLVIISVVYFYANSDYPVSANIGTLDGIVGLFSIVWLVVEIVSMLFNSRRRAVHDLMAGSVVVSLREMEREQKLQEHYDWINSLGEENKKLQVP